VTRHGGVYSLESRDGQDLYFTKGESSNLSGIWRMPVADGEETEVVPAPVNWGEWTLAANGIYYAHYGEASRREQDYAIRFLDFESGEVTELFHRQGQFGHSWLAVSPDEQWILYSETPYGTSELMLVENFR
jgi:hypothetical protein